MVLFTIALLGIYLGIGKEDRRAASKRLSTKLAPPLRIIVQRYPFLFLSPYLSVPVLYTSYSYKASSLLKSRQISCPKVQHVLFHFISPLVRPLFFLFPFRPNPSPPRISDFSSNLARPFLVLRVELELPHPFRDSRI